MAIGHSSPMIGNAVQTFFNKNILASGLADITDFQVTDFSKINLFPNTESVFVKIKFAIPFCFQFNVIS